MAYISLLTTDVDECVYKDVPGCAWGPWVPPTFSLVAAPKLTSGLPATSSDRISLSPRQAVPLHYSLMERREEVETKRGSVLPSA